MNMLFLVELFKYLVQLVKTGKGLLAYTILLVAVSASLAWGGKSYVDEKHKEGVHAIEENEKRISKLGESQVQMVATLQVVKNTLENVNDSVKDMKRAVNDTSKSVSKTQEKVLEIYQDVYEIKLKQNQGG